MDGDIWVNAGSRASARRGGANSAISGAASPSAAIAAPGRHGMGRELDDDELFGDTASHAATAPHAAALTTTTMDEGRRRPRRPRVAMSPPRKGHELKDAELFGNNHKPDDNGERGRTRKERHKPAAWEVRRLETESVGATPSDAAAAAAEGGSPCAATLCGGAPALSLLSARAVRTRLQRGAVPDLSQLADAHLHEVLSVATTVLTAPLLVRLEEAHTSRILPLEAAWAALAARRFHLDSRPPGCASWREAYERRAAAESDALQRSRERVRSGYASPAAPHRLQLPPARDAAAAAAAARRRKGVAGRRRDGPSTPLERLRLEFRRDKRRRFR